MVNETQKGNLGKASDFIAFPVLGPIAANGLAVKIRNISESSTGVDGGRSLGSTCCIPGRPLTGGAAKTLKSYGPEAQA